MTPAQVAEMKAMKKIKIFSEQAETNLLDKTPHLVAAEIQNEIRDALLSVNGNATSFTITLPAEVIRAAARAERHLDAHNVADSDRNGAIATLRPEGPYANAYKNPAISTQITLKRAGGVWSLVAVDRVAVYPRNPEQFRVSITDRAAAKLVKRTLAAFCRTELPVAA